MEENKNINNTDDIDSKDMTEESMAEESTTDGDLGEQNPAADTEQTESAENAAEDTEADELEEESAEAGESADADGKKFFKKKAKTDKKQDAMKQKVDELEDRVKRQMAEFDNFRKRTEKEKAAMFETGARSVIEKILPVVDNFERGLATVVGEKDNGFADGMQMIYKQLMTELDALGVKPIEAVGQEFDPNYHNAVMQVESEEYESGIIAQELQKGYMYRDTVVRHSMVAVVS